ncbi:MAG: hypothetical protein SF182_23335 [Deltaproteobacteria bacterium]|nr:hypothetical protein [Deltaproteobacteria bacterium]
MRTPHGSRSFGQLLVFLLLGMCVAWALLMVGCSSRSSERLKLPPTVSGQLPADYKLELSRGVAVARIVVTTQGEPGLGPFTNNPLYIQLHPGEGVERGADRSTATVTFPPPGTYVFGGESSRPSLYRYEPPGLMAVSVLEGMYDGLAIAYPDMSHETATPSSIPAPSSDFAFTAVNIPGEEIVYLGDIEIRQSYSAWDVFSDKVDVVYAVTDNYDRTTADFRARYPQFADREIKRRVVVPK